MSIIEIEKLSRDFGNEKGIFDISIQVDPGEAFGFLGPNGAGKTTTIRHLMGFIQSQKGSCKILGMDCWKYRDVIQKNVGYIPGEIHFFEDMTGNEFLKFIRSYRKLSGVDRTQEMLERFELDPRAKIKKMSKGMKQKLGIVSCFMHDPDILILDEPTSGLDPLMQNTFVELIAQEKKKGKTIFLSSHIFDEVERTCDRIGIIRQGRLVTVDAVDTLRQRHMHSYTVHLNSKELARSFAKDFDGKCDGTSVTVLAKQSLESIFLHYYDRGENDV